MLENENNIKDTELQETNDKQEDEYEKFCFMCRRPESIAGKMIELPNHIHVCSDCMQKSFDAMNNGQIDYSKLMNIPGIQVMNVEDLESMIPKQQKVKKKKPKEESKPALDIKNIPAPHKIKASLDEYIVGQEHAKKAMAVAVYNHYKRVATNTMDDIEIEKSNMLMIGPTGCGKTYLVKTLARLLDVPLAITDATSLTEAGYIGDDIESVVSKLLAAADNDVEKAEQGIIFIDEIDKIAKKKNTNQRDVSGESVQQGMLKLLEGSDVEVPVGANSKNAMVPLTTVNTKNILFICGGAFPDLEEIIKERLNKQASVGFMADLKDKYNNDKNLLEKVEVEDLRNFGMIPEFIGRLPVIFTLQGLDKDKLVRILKEPKNAILKQYQKLLALDEVKLEFDEEALGAIAERAMKKDTGARALRAIIEEFMLDIMYEIPKDDNIGQVTITKAYIEGTGGPIITLRGQAAIEQKS
ncbi:ATP-dependent Clp protease ATP-binding subunit ClpX [Faecalimonas canis]